MWVCRSCSIAVLINAGGSVERGYHQRSAISLAWERKGESFRWVARTATFNRAWSRMEERKAVATFLAVTWRTTSLKSPVLFQAANATQSLSCDCLKQASLL